MKLTLNEPNGYFSLYGYADFTKYIDAVLNFYNNNTYSEIFIPFDMNITFNGKRMRFIDNGKVKPKADEYLKELKHMPAEKKKFSSVQEIVIDEKKQELWIKI